MDLKEGDVIIAKKFTPLPKCLKAGQEYVVTYYSPDDKLMVTCSGYYSGETRHFIDNEFTDEHFVKKEP